MRDDLYQFKISDQKKNKTGLTKQQINNELMIGGYPAIYIESNDNLSILNNIVECRDNTFSISGMTILELVVKLNNIGIDSYITNSSISFMPAELLLDINNNIYFSEGIDLSPKDMSEIHNRNILNVPGAEESSIIREIVKVYSFQNGEIHNNKYQIDNNLLYINNITEETMAIIRYKLNKFFIYIGKENILETNYIIKKSKDNKSNKILLDNVNLINWNSI